MGIFRAQKMFDTLVNVNGQVLNAGLDTTKKSQSYYDTLFQEKDLNSNAKDPNTNVVDKNAKVGEATRARDLAGNEVSVAKKAETGAYNAGVKAGEINGATNAKKSVGAMEGITNSFKNGSTLKKAGMIGGGLLAGGLAIKGAASMLGGNSQQNFSYSSEGRRRLFSEDTNQNLKEAALIGTGLAGTAGAIYLAKKGHLGEGAKKTYENTSKKVKGIWTDYHVPDKSAVNYNDIPWPKDTWDKIKKYAKDNKLDLNKDREKILRGLHIIK